MSLVIGLVKNSSIYLAADARTRQDIPLVGSRWYDCSQKLGISSENRRIWMAGVGDMISGGKISDEIYYRGTKYVDELDDINEGLFEDIHLQTLKKYNLAYEGINDLQNCLTLLFVGITEGGDPRICLIDSAGKYKKKWLKEDGEYFVNRIDDGELDNAIQEKVSSMIGNIKNKEKVDSYLIEEMKKIFLYVSNVDVGIGPMMYFLKLNGNEYRYEELNKARKIMGHIKFKVENLLFVRLLQLHKLSPHCHTDFRDNSK